MVHIGSKEPQDNESTSGSPHTEYAVSIPITKRAMTCFFFTVIIVLLSVSLLGCVNSNVQETTVQIPLPDTLILPVKVHLVNTPGYTSRRDVAAIKALFLQVNNIWSQAGIKVAITEIVNTEMSSKDYQEVLRGNISSLVAQEDFFS